MKIEARSRDHLTLSNAPRKIPTVFILSRIQITNLAGIAHSVAVALTGIVSKQPGVWNSAEVAVKEPLEAAIAVIILAKGTHRGSSPDFR